MEPGGASAEGIAGEVRLDLSGASYRISEGLEDLDSFDRYDAQVAERSLHLGPGLGLRLYPWGRHGIYGLFGARTDLDTDGWSDENSHPVDLLLGQAGYAHRRVWSMSRRPERRAMALTIRSGVALGTARSSGAVEGVPQRSLVVGPALALDIDFHFGRFFMGHSFGYQLLFHLEGEMTRSHLFDWNIVPLAHVGVTFGDRLQSPRTEPGG